LLFSINLQNLAEEPTNKIYKCFSNFKKLIKIIWLKIEAKEIINLFSKDVFLTFKKILFNIKKQEFHLTTKSKAQGRNQGGRRL